MGGEDEGECQEEVAGELEERELDNEGGGGGQERMKATSLSCFSPSLSRFTPSNGRTRGGEEWGGSQE